MRRSNIKKRTKKTSSFYNCYVQPGCNYSTPNYFALKKHTLDHESSNIANGLNDIYFGIIESKLANVMPVPLKNLKVVNSEYMSKYFTNSANPSTLIFMILDTLKFINKQNSILYYEVNFFPNYERRIVTFPLDKFGHLTEEELIDFPLLIYDYYIRCIESGYYNKMDLISNAKILPRTTL